MQMELLLWDAFDMRRPWMPIYYADVAVDTAGMGFVGIGIYFALRILAWRSGDGSVTGDLEELKRTLKTFDPDFHGLTFNRIVPKLLERFFKRRDDGRFYQEEVENELRKAQEISEKRSRIAQERWSEVNKNKDMADANAMPTQHNTTQHNREDRESASALRSEAKKGSRLSEDWKPSPDLLHFAAGEGLSAQEIEREAAKFRDYWVGRAGSGGVKLDWPATWRNWVRKTRENKSNGRYVQDDSKSASAAAGRLAELARKGHFTFGPRPSRILSDEIPNVVRLVPQGSGEQSRAICGGNSGDIPRLPDVGSRGGG